GQSLTKQFPELSESARSILARSAILDGEIAALDAAGRPEFALIQPRIMAASASGIKKMSEEHPVTYFVFDILYLDGEDLRPLPLRDRRARLERVIPTGAAIRFSQELKGSPAELLRVAREHRLEGVMAKQAASVYESGRSADWLKVKIVNEQEFVIGGFTATGRRAFGALLLGVYDSGKLRFTGKVGAGFDEKSLASIYRRLKPLIVKKSPFSAKLDLRDAIQFVQPELVCRVRFADWTRDGRLRSPVFLGLQIDKKPANCVREPAGAAAVPPANVPNAAVPDNPVVDGHTLKLTHLSKPLFPGGETKGDLLHYYDGVAEWLLPHLRDRPLMLRRYPNGIDAEAFFQKNPPPQFPDFIRAPSTDPAFKEFIVCNGRAGLLYLTNLGCIDQNAWMSRIASITEPDFVLIDLDPYQCSYDQVVEAALAVEELLTGLHVKGYPKTTGGDGMHIYIPIAPGHTYQQARSFAEILLHLTAAQRPDLFTKPRATRKREPGKVYFDYVQIGQGKTISTPYAVRPYPGAPVATPLDWSEVRRGLSPLQFTIKTALHRFRREGDLFAPVLAGTQKLAPILKKLENPAR
ncbi:MAG: DNA ligase D, partial [Bryobacteraceae bacterium]